MQQYLFRGKRKDNGEWVYGSLLQSEIDVNEKFVQCQMHERFASDFSIAAYDVIPETVGMWTGLTDKNGVKIFEGDLYHTNVSKQDGYHVMFISGAFVGGTNDKSCSPLGWQPDGSGDDLILDKTETWLIVVGNIHDNPELLTPAK